MKDREPIVKSLNPHEIRKGLKARKENQALDLLDAHIRSYNSLWDLFSFSKKKVIEQSKELSDTKSIIEAMKCCGNCGTYEDCLNNENAFYRNRCDKWKIKKGVL